MKRRLLVHLVEFALDDVSNLICLAAKLAHELSDASGQLWQALGPQDEEGDHGDKYKLA